MKKIAAALILLSAVSATKLSAQVTDERVRAVLATSAVTDMFADVPHTIVASIASLSPDADTAAVAAAVRTHFSQDSLVARVAAHLMESADPALFDDLYAWLLADSIRTLEARGDAAGRSTPLEQYASALQQREPDQDLVELAEAFAQVQGAGEFYVVYLMALRDATATVAAASGRPIPATPEPTEAQIDQAIAHFHGVSVLSFLQRFEALTPAEARRLVDAYATESGRWYIRTYTDAVGIALRAAGERTAAALR
ncbi:MAG TPA: hypothetical protein VF039_05520 [Longimicrobiales bacterium]